MSKILKQGESENAICEDCDQRMDSGNGCCADLIFIGSKCYRRIVNAADTDSYEACKDCNVKTGQYHHLGCDMERCPSCHGQLISCGCHVRFALEEELLKKKRAMVNVIESA